MSIVKLSGGGLFILNPIAATRELLDMVHELEKQHGPVKHVVLSTVAIEHKAYAAVWTSKFNLCFNSGSLEVCVRCCSLQSVEGIPRRSCPSLGRKSPVEFHAASCLFSFLFRLLLLLA